MNDLERLVATLESLQSDHAGTVRIGAPPLPGQLASLPDALHRETDAIIIGAGHNGIVCATYLARAGQRVLVLDATDTPGGLAAGREFQEELGGGDEIKMLGPLSSVYVSASNFLIAPWLGVADAQRTGVPSFQVDPFWPRMPVETGVGSVKAILIDPESGALFGGVSPTGDSYVIGW